MAKFSLLVVLVLFLFSFASATCPFFDISVATQASVVQGVKAVYPIALTNRGLDEKLTQLSGTCPEGLGCLFTPVPYATIKPSDSASFTLQVNTAEAVSGNYSLPLDVSMDGAVCQSYSLALEVKPGAPVEKKPFEVKITPDKNMSARPQETISYAITVKNNDAERGFARISAKTELQVDFSANDVDVDAESEKVVTAKVYVPAGTPRGKYDVLFVINAFEGRGCCEHSFALPRQVFVFADKLSLAVQNFPLTCVNAAHENQTKHTFSIRNDGEIKGPYSFSVESSPAVEDFAKLDADILDIIPGDTQQLTLKLMPSKSVELRSYPLRIKATYLGYTIFEKPFCVKVDAAHNFRIFGPEYEQITRTESKQVDFLLRNTGTIRENYAITALVSKSMDYRIVENSVTLAPGEAKNVSVIVGTTMQTPLGEHFVLLRVSDGRVTKAVNTTIRVVSSTKLGKSFLSIQAKPVNAYVGVNSTVAVGVKNTGSKTLYGIGLRLSGLPNWAKVAEEPKHILAGKTAFFNVLFNVPLDAEQKSHIFSYIAESSSGEKIEDFNVLSIAKPPAHLNVAVTNVLRRGNEVAFSVVVYNNGALPLSNVVVEAGDKELTLDSLAPGEQRLLSFQGLAAGPLVVKARSREGVESNAENIAPPTPSSFPVNGVLVALILLILVLVAIAFLMRKEQLEESAKT